MIEVKEEIGKCRRCGCEALLGNGLCQTCWDNDGELLESELEVLNLMAEGCTYPRIAEIRHVSYQTVKNQIQKIYSKLGVHNSNRAVDKARAMHLIRASV